MANPIKYTDLFDSGVQRGVSDLKEAIEATAQSLDKMLENARAKGNALKEALGVANPGSASGQAEIARLSKEVEDLRNQLTRLTEARKAAANASRMATEADKERIRAKEELRLRTRELTAEVRDEIATDKLTEEEMKRLSNAANLQAMSYNELSRAYTQLVARANAMHASDQQQIADRQKMIQTAGMVRQEMIKLKEGMGNYTLSVGNYAKAFNGLDLAMQQIVRETPTIAMGARMYFMAISNNLPILTDQIRLYNQRRKAELENIATMEAQMATMKAEGATAEQVAAQERALNLARQQSIPVGKALLQSLLSWQTIMILGITLLTQYGDKIVDWVAGLFSAEKATRAWTEALEDFNKTIDEGEVSAAKAYAQADTLYKIATDNTRAVEDRIKAGQILQNQYEDYFGDLSTEEIMLGKAKLAHDNLTKSLMDQARARAYLDKITELYGKRIEAQWKASKAELFYNDRQTRADAALASAQGMSYGSQGAYQNAGNWQNAANRAKEAWETAKDSVAAIDDEIKNLRDEIPVDGLFDELFNGSGGGRQGADKVTADFVAQIDNIRLIRAAREAEINNIEDDTERELALTEFKYKNEIQDLADYATQQMAIINVINDLERQRDEATTLEKRNLLTEQMNDLKRQWNATEEGIQAVNDEIVAKERELTTRLEEIREERLRKEIAAYENILKQRLDLYNQQAENELEGDELEQQKLQNQLNYWTALLVVTEQFNDGSEETQIRLASIRATIEGLFKAMDEQGDEGGSNILESLFGKDFNKWLRGLERVLKMTANNIKEIISLYEEMAKAAVEAAEKQVSAAEKVYDAELTAYENGYANNVEFARKELELRRQSLAEAQAEAERYARMQEQVDSMTQISSMITAAANLMKGWSEVPFVGQALGVAAITAMFASFVAAKVQARQLAGTKQYGEGGTEYIDYGNSHASGHDVDFGRLPDGTPRRIERGETVAVINARSTGKYGYSTIADIVDSINKGAFVEKYMSSFSGGDGEFTVNSTTSLDSPWFATMAQDLKAIRKNGEEGTTVLPDGTTIVRYKNYTRKIRS